MKPCSGCPKCQARPRKILVCGGRDYQNKDNVYRTLDNLAEVDDDHWLGVPVIIINGRASGGADSFATDWAIVHWQQFMEYPADWNKYSKAAGPIRNQQMLDENPDISIVVAFPGGKGTADMVNRAKKANIEVLDLRNN